jgi:hypothetical protein
MANEDRDELDDVDDDEKPFGNEEEETIACKWKGCSHVASGAEALYDHLCNVHVGRKSTNNLCLTCGWEGCGTKCVKRDHITSHLRGLSSSQHSF